MFNLAIDSKLRGCDVVALKVEDVAPNGYTMDRATVRQKKTGRPVKFELTDQTRQASVVGRGPHCDATRRSLAIASYSAIAASGRWATHQDVINISSNWRRLH
jgi:hypothetical protein